MKMYAPSDMSFIKRQMQKRKKSHMNFHTKTQTIANNVSSTTKVTHMQETIH